MLFFLRLVESEKEPPTNSKIMQWPLSNAAIRRAAVGLTQLGHFKMGSLDCTAAEIFHESDKSSSNPANIADFTNH
jgi:hypothetical protein|tara:strand:- start:354 stop:581 length:228 start_codon:yes stop_codon:yes gene_type:complete